MSAQFETKDSGVRMSYASGMSRDTERGKPRFDLLIPKGVPFEAQMLTRFAALMARGAEKYGDRNWEQADSTDELERYYSSAFRHFMQWLAGETDEDHAAAVMFNLMAAETLKWKLEEARHAGLQQCYEAEDDGPSWCEGDEEPEGWKDLGYTTEGVTLTPIEPAVTTGRIWWAPAPLRAEYSIPFKWTCGSPAIEPAKPEALSYEFDNEERAWRATG